MIKRSRLIAPRASEIQGPEIDMANIAHKGGGKITGIVAIAHSTYKGRAEWHFVGTCEWLDGSHARSPGRLYDIEPGALCTPEDDSPADIDAAMNALSAYLNRNGNWNDRGVWVPHTKAGREEFKL
jgi:hypothetical protein